METRARNRTAPDAPTSRGGFSILTALAELKRERRPPARRETC